MKFGYVVGLLCLCTTGAWACCDMVIPEPMIKYTQRIYSQPRHPRRDITPNLDAMMFSILSPNFATKAADVSVSDLKAKDFTIRTLLYPANFVPATPEDVYGVMLQDCLDGHATNDASGKMVNIRQPYEYCKCVADAARAQSYGYDVITKSVYNTIKSQHYNKCDNLFDLIYTMPEVYSNIYWLCRTGANDAAPCDNLAVDVRASVIRALGDIRPEDDRYIMYDSEYQQLIHHPDFLAIMDDIRNSCDMDY